ncbi:prostaglandin E2 receptor EP2 subtype-like [Glandiceps talaboti]
MGEERPNSLPLDMRIQSILILLIGLFANIMIVYLLSNYTLPSSFMPLFFLKVLAWVDLTSLILFLLRAILSSVIKKLNFTFYCNLNVFTNGFLPYISGFIAMLMSIERFLAFKYPFFYHRNVNRKVAIASVVIVILLVTIITGLPFLGIGSYHGFENGEGFCKYYWVPEASVGESIHFVVYILCGLAILIITVCCNIAVIHELYVMQNRVYQLPQPTGSNHNNAEQSNQESQYHQMPLDHLRQIRFGKMMVVIAIIFTICWLPWLVWKSESNIDEELTLTKGVDPFVTLVLTPKNVILLEEPDLDKDLCVRNETR